MQIEIYWNENRTALMTEDVILGSTSKLEEWSQHQIQAFDAAISTYRPKAYKALCSEFGYGPQFAYNRIYQFAACNFSTRDGRVDISDDFSFVVERVPCPIRHKCKDVYCCSENTLSERELDIVRLFVRGLSDDSIADKLFISKATVHNHITNIYKKLGFTGSTHPDRLLLNYAFSNKIL